jgi:hypothetical protein
MDKQKRDGVLHRAWLMDKVDLVYAMAVNVNWDRILGYFVQLCFHSPPVEVVLPEVSESYDIGEWWATSPWLHVDDFCGKVGKCKLLPQPRNLLFWDINLEGCDGGHDCAFSGRYGSIMGRGKVLVTELTLYPVHALDRLTCFWFFPSQGRDGKSSPSNGTKFSMKVITGRLFCRRARPVH